MINCVNNKIMSYDKFLGDNKIISISNTEGIIYLFNLDSHADMIFTEISNIKKDLEKI
jgi:hypothetical protein